MKLNESTCVNTVSGEACSQKEPYAAPVIEVVDVKVEQGFATSMPSWEDPQPW